MSGGWPWDFWTINSMIPNLDKKSALCFGPTLARPNPPNPRPRDVQIFTSWNFEGSEAREKKWIRYLQPKKKGKTVCCWPGVKLVDVWFLCIDMFKYIYCICIYIYIWLFKAKFKVLISLAHTWFEHFLLRGLELLFGGECLSLLYAWEVSRSNILRVTC